MITLQLPNGHRVRVNLDVRVSVGIAPDRFLNALSVEDLAAVSEVSRCLHSLVRTMEEEIRQLFENTINQAQREREAHRIGITTSQGMTATDAAQRYGVNAFVTYDRPITEEARRQLAALGRANNPFGSGLSSLVQNIQESAAGDGTGENHDH